MTDHSELNRALESLDQWSTAWCAPPPMRLSQWAERHFYLSAESSYLEQRWRCYPPQRAVMDCMSHDDIREVVVMKSARVGYTKMLGAALCYNAQHKRRNQAIWQPTDEDADDFVKTEVDPMLRDVRVMESVFPAFMQRDRDNTLRAKRFLGSVLHIRGGKAAKNYRRLTVDVAIIDELDGFDLDIEKEGSPVTLSAKRIEGATYPKHILGSTPKLKHFSMIEARYQQAERRFRWQAPCPECGIEHVLSWGGAKAAHGMKWNEGEPDSVRQLCPHCGALYTQQDYLRVWGSGRWVDEDGVWIDHEGRFRTREGADIPAPRSVGVHQWTAQLPQTTWPQIVHEFLAAVAKARTGDKSELKGFVNTTLGETWEEEVQQADQHELMARAEPYPLRFCPRGALILTAGVDTQDNRWEVTVWGWGRGEESWAVDHMVLEGNPADERDWDRLDVYLQTLFAHESGQRLHIEGVAVDTGGHFTHQVYNYCRLRSHRRLPNHRDRSQRIYAVHGSTKEGQPVKGRSSLQDVNYRGKIIPAGVRLWAVGTDTAKDLLFGRLHVTESGPGRVHFSKDMPPVWFQQLTAEARVLVKTSTGEKWRWVARQARNEALDCTVYAMFAGHALDLPRYSDAMWSRLEERINPTQGDLLRQASVEPEPAECAPEPEPDAPGAAPHRRPQPRGFVGGWVGGGRLR
jgi:phage terminase large subunit GpA-like protein